MIKKWDGVIFFVHVSSSIIKQFALLLDEWHKHYWSCYYVDGVNSTGLVARLMALTTFSLLLDRWRQYYWPRNWINDVNSISLVGVFKAEIYRFLLYNLTAKSDRPQLIDGIWDGFVRSRCTTNPLQVDFRCRLAVPKFRCQQKFSQDWEYDSMAFLWRIWLI